MRFTAQITHTIGRFIRICNWYFNKFVLAKILTNEWCTNHVKWWQTHDEQPRTIMKTSSLKVESTREDVEGCTLAVAIDCSICWKFSNSGKSQKEIAAINKQELTKIAVIHRFSMTHTALQAVLCFMELWFL